MQLFYLQITKHYNKPHRNTAITTRFQAFYTQENRRQNRLKAK